MLHPDNYAYAGKSLIVVNIDAHKQKIYFIDASKVLMSTSHNSFNYSIKGCKYTSILFLGESGPDMSSDIMKLGCFMQIHGGRLYGTKITGHVL